ncbi:hypothetical protein KIN20_005020 [Parelaphostrongylus tenuis]|uniref:Uncharacterized protein n=1 Tax=Parelaphostrongylus tenuis TaxID=148309 RepID=A0AAD5MI84_PARTN|nr:hypothetical protein KIN20_005020 [Parelaphostrongylus tenuis]
MRLLAKLLVDEVNWCNLLATVRCETPSSSAKLRMLDEGSSSTAVHNHFHPNQMASQNEAHLRDQE